jgi:hypothetical protein
MKGQRFADIPDIQRNMTTLLRGIQEIDFKTFRQWHHRLTKCTASQGEHFAAASAQVSKFCSRRAIKGIKLS